MPGLNLPVKFIANIGYPVPSHPSKYEIIVLVLSSAEMPTKRNTIIDAIAFIWRRTDGALVGEVVGGTGRGGGWGGGPSAGER